MKISINIIVITIITIACLGIIFKVVGKISDINSEINSQEINHYIDSENEKLILTGKFNSNSACEIKETLNESQINTINTKLDKTFNKKINISKTGNYSFTINCCNLKNECKEKIITYSK